MTPIQEDLPEPIKGLLYGEYWLLSIDFEKACIRIRKARDGQYVFKDRMNKIVGNDPNLLGLIAEQVWRGNLDYKISPWRTS